MRWRVAGAFVAVVLLVLLVHDLPLSSFLRSVERDRIVTGLQRDAFVLAGRATDALRADPVTASAALREVAATYRDATGASVVIVDRRGVAVATAGPDLPVGESFRDRPEIATALTGIPVNGERESRTLGEPLLYVAVPALSGTGTYGAVRITYPVSVVDARVAASLRGLVLVAVLTLLASVVVAVLVAGTVTRPLRQVQEATARLADGDLAVRIVDPGGPPEVRDLARDVTSMAERLEQVVAAQRAFAGDASHQLRTPLTALRLRLDTAAEALDEGDHATTSSSLEAARSETARLARLVDGLLALARAEGRQPDLVDVDVVAVVADRAAMWEPLAAERGVRVVCHAPPQAMALAVDGALEQIVDNYVDNALEVSPEGSTITVDVTAQAGRVVVRVVDEGPGIDESAAARAFDRFWRGRQDAEGSGLGLAVVASLARAGNATVGLRRVDGGRGTEAYVELPRST